MIRSATPDETPPIVDLAVAAGLFAAEDAHVVETLMRDHFARGRDEGHRCLVSAPDGRPVAVAYAQPAPATDRAWYLTMIAVAPERQGRGDGTALLGHLESALRDDGQRLLLVETSGSPAFARTRRFYDGLGYEQEARVRDFYETGDDMVLFRKDLAA
jgi:ribosomal protein S18 acetylase RimI-like enzyme